MACQLQLNVFYTLDTKDKKKITNIYKTSAQRALSAFTQDLVLWVAGGGKRGGSEYPPAYIIGGGVKTPQLGVNNRRPIVSHQGCLSRTAICLVLLSSILCNK